ncbi:MAG: hypothetical protein IT371_05160 [Deltaproteobacteria bacterium]|nr:hypothetical protein [Deltaproteobacteria bacterium]
MARLRSAAPWLILGAAGLALVLHGLAYGFVCDDAYITFRYSHNLAYHGELSFNLGDRVEGYTNFLWTVLLGGLLKLGLRPDVMSLVLASAAGVGTLGLLYLAGRAYRGGRATGWELLGPALLPACAYFAVWCSGGLETQLFTCLGTAGFALYLAEAAGRVRRRYSGLCFALAAMTRPEGLLLFGLTGLHRVAANLLGERRLLPTRAEFFWLAGFLVPFGLFFAWRYRYYGFPFPNTFYIKTGGGAAMAGKWGLPYLWDFVHHNRLYVLAPLLLLFRPRTLRPEESEAGRPPGLRPRFVFSYVALLLGCYSFYVVWVGGDFMALGRFFAPVLPLWAFLAQELLREAFERPRAASPEVWRASRLLPVAALLLGLLSWSAVGLHRDNQKPSYYRWGLDTVAYLKRFADDRVLLGNWMRRNLPKDTYLAVGGAGAVVYASRLKALDAFGLSDRWIAHHGPRSGDRPGHSKFAPEEYVLKERPDLICHIGHHQDEPYQPSPGEAALWRARGYAWVCLEPPGLSPRYYCCLKRLDRTLGPFPSEVGS